MTKKDRNRMIEVLLWSGSDPQHLISSLALTEFEGLALSYDVVRLHQGVDTYFSDYEMASLETAYRLIEEDKALIKKWFGKS